MIVPFFFRQIQKRMVQTLAAVVMCIVFAFTFCSIQRSGGEMDKQIQEIYESVPIRCALSNPTGTQLGRLDIPLNIIRMFLPEEGESSAFLEYIENVQAHILLNCYGVNRSTTLNGLTSLEAMPSINEVEWKEGYDESIFSKNSLWCIAPWFVEGDSVQLYFSEEENRQLSGEEGVQLEFTIAGTCQGAEYYCSWDTARNLSSELWGEVKAESISAVIKDNTRLEEFKTDYVEKVFCEPSLDYKGNKRFGLVIYDDKLEQAVGQLKQNRMFLDMTLVALFVVSFGIGLVFSFLCLRSRTQELWLQYILGVKKVRIFFAALLEQGVLGLAGIGIGTGIYLVTSRMLPDIGILAVFWVVYLSGTALAYLVTMRKRFLNTGVGGE